MRMAAPHGFAQKVATLSRPLVRPDGRECPGLDEAAATALAGEFKLPMCEVHALSLDAGIVPERYLRNFDALTPPEQARLLRSKAMLCGLGGLGGNILETLARMGVGTIVAADGDAFEPSNLNRQLLAETATLGRSKAKAALARAHDINPNIECSAQPVFWDHDAMLDVLSGAQVAIDALGGLDDRPALAEAAAQAGVPLVTAAIAGNTGYVATVLPGETGPATLIGTGAAAEDTLGSPAPSVSVAANLQCAEAIRILARQRPVLAGKILLFDLNDMTFETISLG